MEGNLKRPSERMSLGLTLYLGDHFTRIWPGHPLLQLHGGRPQLPEGGLNSSFIFKQRVAKQLTNNHKMTIKSTITYNILIAHSFWKYYCAVAKNEASGIILPGLKPQIHHHQQAL